MRYIGVITHLLTIDPNFLGHPSVRFRGDWFNIPSSSTGGSIVQPCSPFHPRSSLDFPKSMLFNTPASDQIRLWWEVGKKIRLCVWIIQKLQETRRNILHIIYTLTWNPKLKTSISFMVVSIRWWAKSLWMEKWLETSIFENLPTRIGREFVAKKNMVHTQKIFHMAAFNQKTKTNRSSGNTFKKD